MGLSLSTEREQGLANRARLLKAVGMGERSWCGARQVHGATVIDADEPLDDAEADGLTTQRADVAIGVIVADCVPVLLANRRGSVVAAVHAGWRGVVAGVVPHAVRQFGQRVNAVTPADLVAAIGPCIGTAAFEVGHEVAAAFKEAGLNASIDTSRISGSGGRPHIDLRGAVRDQLTASGVPSDAIDISDTCTFRDVDDCFSYRRDGDSAGRQGAVIGVRRDA